MVSSTTFGRHAWQDRFRAPTVEDLREPYAGLNARLFDECRERLLATGFLDEGICWQGIPWRWTITYTGPFDSERPWAYIIPHPEKPLVASPIVEAMVVALPWERLKRFIRDGLEGARRVNNVRWAVWELSNRTNLDDVFDLLRRKRRYFEAVRRDEEMSGAA